MSMRNVLFAPLNLDGKTVGIIGVANKPSDFTEEAARIASIFADLAAIGLANSRYLDQLKEKTEALEQALDEVQTLRGLLPICSCCKKIRDEDGHWHPVESYVSHHTTAKFSHGFCPSCLEEQLAEIRGKR